MPWCLDAWKSEEMATPRWGQPAKKPPSVRTWRSPFDDQKQPACTPIGSHVAAGVVLVTLALVLISSAIFRRRGGAKRYGGTKQETRRGTASTSPASPPGPRINGMVVKVVLKDDSWWYKSRGDGAANDETRAPRPSFAMGANKLAAADVEPRAPRRSFPRGTSNRPTPDSSPAVGTPDAKPSQSRVHETPACSPCKDRPAMRQALTFDDDAQGRNAAASELNLSERVWMEMEKAVRADRQAAAAAPSPRMAKQGQLAHGPRQAEADPSQALVQPGDQPPTEEHQPRARAALTLPATAAPEATTQLSQQAQIAADSGRTSPEATDCTEATEQRMTAGAAAGSTVASSESHSLESALSSTHPRAAAGVASESSAPEVEARSSEVEARSTSDAVAAAMGHDPSPCLDELLDEADLDPDHPGGGERSMRATKHHPDHTTPCPEATRVEAMPVATSSGSKEWVEERVRRARAKKSGSYDSTEEGGKKSGASTVDVSEDNAPSTLVALPSGRLPAPAPVAMPARDSPSPPQGRGSQGRAFDREPSSEPRAALTTSALLGASPSAPAVIVGTGQHDCSSAADAQATSHAAPPSTSTATVPTSPLTTSATSPALPTAQRWPTEETVPLALRPAADPPPSLLTTAMTTATATARQVAAAPASPLAPSYPTFGADGSRATSASTARLMATLAAGSSAASEPSAPAPAIDVGFSVVRSTRVVSVIAPTPAPAPSGALTHDRRTMSMRRPGKQSGTAGASPLPSPSLAQVSADVPKQTLPALPSAFCVELRGPSEPSPVQKAGVGASASANQGVSAASGTLASKLPPPPSMTPSVARADTQTPNQQMAAEDELSSWLREIGSEVDETPLRPATTSHSSAEDEPPLSKARSSLKKRVSAVASALAFTPLRRRAKSPVQKADVAASASANVYQGVSAVSGTMASKTPPPPSMTPSGARADTRTPDQQMAAEEWLRPAKTPPPPSMTPSVARADTRTPDQQMAAEDELSSWLREIGSEVDETPLRPATTSHSSAEDEPPRSKDEPPRSKARSSLKKRVSAVASVASAASALALTPLRRRVNVNKA